MEQSKTIQARLQHQNEDINVTEVDLCLYRQVVIYRTFFSEAVITGLRLLIQQKAGLREQLLADHLISQSELN